MLASGSSMQTFKSYCGRPMTIKLVGADPKLFSSFWSHKRARLVFVDVANTDCAASDSFGAFKQPLLILVHGFSPDTV
jgi:hypothetical protein